MAIDNQDALAATGEVFPIPSEVFSPLGRAMVEASCYPLAEDRGYRITVEPAYGMDLEGHRPWDKDWPAYGSLVLPENPNGSFEKVLQNRLAAGGLYVVFLSPHFNYLMTPSNGICNRYSVGVERRRR